MLFFTIFYSACNSTDPNPEGKWTEEEQKSYQDAIGIQDQIGDDLDDWFQTMDSTDAINKAFQSFESSAEVSSTILSSQGIAVQYANGMRGGLFIFGEDADTESELNYAEMEANNTTPNSLKSLVNKRKMILINPHYYERQFYTDQILHILNVKLGRIGMAINPFYKNEEATVDRFTELSGYGIIQIYSHGMAWPIKHNITEVYLMTGEVANENTSMKYWSELRDGNIPIMRVSNISNKYFLSPQFINENNDFSNDTILFYGGFCYSFLGTWPELVHSFADGAYTGFDWSVITSYNANWAVNSIALMSDTSKNEPLTLQGWWDDPSLAKSYWNNEDSRTTKIHYAGDSRLTLWSDVNVALQALSDDGAPISVPGNSGEEYPFKCTAVTYISPLQYVWDSGDGSSPITTDEDEVLISWNENGTYLLKVDVKDKNTGEIIGSTEKTVIIGEDNQAIIDFVTATNGTRVEFSYSSAIHPNLKSDFSFYLDRIPTTWNGLSFSGTRTDEFGEFFANVEGEISADGEKLNIRVQEIYELQDGSYRHDVKLTISDYPFYWILEWNNSAVFKVYSPNIGNYITDLSGTIRTNDETVTLSLDDLNNDRLNHLDIIFNSISKGYNDNKRNFKKVSTK